MYWLRAAVLHDYWALGMRGPQFGGTVQPTVTPVVVTSILVSTYWGLATPLPSPC
ncbi:hypothetical protein CDEST_05676 [Colletotrichum destructivum]|uniref:Uncharacterized protein n=1 Tax=Colletotrichum destructivum TaxID=34406 RepID=A0AAX4IBF7_9PEZI|nr:hypothetical protein CDEST_05676 [Colletotrichum destructivum]